MVTKRNFGIIGGDFRQIHLAQKILSNQNNVNLWGFDKLSDSEFLPLCKNLDELINKSEYLIFPVPITKDSATLNAPMTTNKITLNRDFFSKIKNKISFGAIDSLAQNKYAITSYDYSKNESFQIMNAIPTAEGAIEIALKETDKTLFECNCLITGFGRIAKVLAQRLRDFNTKIYLSSRKNEDINWISALGYNPVHMHHMEQNLEIYDIIFNTVPNIIFDYNLLSKCNPNVIIIDLASEPGGFDKISIQKLGLKHIHALGIPGKMFPQSAANIIYDTINKIMEENNL